MSMHISPGCKRAVFRQAGADAYSVDERATSDATARISEKTKGLFI
jgi:hypothetical protein